MKEQWSSILDRLRDIVPGGEFKAYLEPLRGDVVPLQSPAHESAQGSLVAQPLSAQWEVRLSTENGFLAGCVRDRFTRVIADAAREVLGGPVKVTVRKSAARKEAKLPEPVQPEPRPEPREDRRQLDLPFIVASAASRRSFNPAVFRTFKHSFDDFVVGPCNKLAYAAATNILEDSAPVDTVFLSAGAGLGKTHLTQAVGRALGENAERSGMRMEYISAEDFTSQFVQAMRYKAMDEFNDRFRSLDMLLLEDVHFLRGKERTQEELLSIIKSIQAHSGRVVLTSSFGPRDLAGLDSQLISRFCSGFVAGMERPDRDTRLDILHRKARKQLMVLPDSVADMLADSVTGDVRLLESCLHNLLLQARISGQGVTEEMAMEVIRTVARVKPSLGLDEIISLVCRSFDLTLNQLASKSRRQELVVARNTAFFLLRKHTDLTLEQIGERFNRKHSTVIKGITSAENEMKRHSALGGQIEHAVNLIERSSKARG